MLTLNLLRLLLAFNSNKFEKTRRIKKMGVLGIRVLQYYSTRIDILSEEMCYFLMNVHTSSVKVEPKHMLTLITNRETSPLHFLEYFDNDPFRCNFVSQIYTGTLKNGEDVAIKFSDLKSKGTLLKQLEKLDRSAKIISYCLPSLSRKYNLETIVEDIRETSLKKLDLLAEMETTRTLKSIKENYVRSYNLGYLHFSDFYEKYSTSEYLISRYHHTTIVKELLHEGVMKYKNVMNIIKAHFFFIFVVGKFHSDVHSGNILIGDYNDIYFIDANSLSEIDDDFRVYFFHFFLALFSGKSEESFEFFLHLIQSDASDKQKSMIYEKFVVIFHEISRKSLSKVNFSKRVISLFKIAIEYGMVFNDSLYLVLKALIRLEDIAAHTSHTSIFVKDLKNILELFKYDERLQLVDSDKDKI